MTLNGVMAVILRYSTEFGSFGANRVKMVKIDPYCLRYKYSLMNLVLALVTIFTEVAENEFVRYRHPLSKAII